MTFQLQERLLQELELLSDKSTSYKGRRKRFQKQVLGLDDSAPSDYDRAILKKLTDKEIAQFWDEGRIPDDPYALAYLNFGRYVAGRTPNDPPDPFKIPPFPRMASLQTLSSDPTFSLPIPLGEHQPTLSPHRVPIYSAPALFPDQSRRLLLERALERLFFSEKRSLKLQPERTPTGPIGTYTSRLDASLPDSGVYVLRNSPEALRIGLEATPAAIALWRMRLWDGEGWLADSSTVEEA